MAAFDEPLSQFLTIRADERGSDRFARLRADLAEAVAAAELLLVRAEIEKWRAIAEERERALARVDLVLEAVAGTNSIAPTPTPTPALVAERPTPVVAEIPQHVRDEAHRYAHASGALRELHSSRRWLKRRP